MIASTCSAAVGNIVSRSGCRRVHHHHRRHFPLICSAGCDQSLVIRQKRFLSSSISSSTLKHCDFCALARCGNQFGVASQHNNRHRRREALQQQHQRFLSVTTSTPIATIIYRDEENNVITAEEMQRKERKGAWTILAALEKAKEAELVEVAGLVSSLEAILPRSSEEQDQEADQKQQQNDDDEINNDNNLRPFFRLPPTKVLTGNDVLSLLQATRRGHLIDVQTVRHLIEGATLLNRSRRSDRLVTIPHLRRNQQIQVVGDLHGSLSDLATVLALMPDGEPTKSNMLLFNGDLTDRGDNGIEVICTVCCLSLAYPDYVFVNRGNHEDIALSIAYGLAAEITKKYDAMTRRFLRPALDAYFRSLPLATVIERDAIIVHAGPPPPKYFKDRSLSDIIRDNPILTGSGLSRTVVNTSGEEEENDDDEMKLINKKGREVIEAMMWSDPLVDECNKKLMDRGGTANNTDDGKDDGDCGGGGWIPNDSRGAGWKYDENIVRDFLNKEGLTRMIRSHEPVHQGCARYEIDNSNDDDGQQPTTMEFFTVFSASRYPYKEGFNQGAILELRSNGKHNVLRYETEDDEPIEAAEGGGTYDSLTDFSYSERERTEESDIKEACSINLDAVRRSLLEAIRYNLVSIFTKLGWDQTASEKERKATVPFDTVVDVFIKSLKLDNEYGLKRKGAKTVLAKALRIECPETKLPPVDVNLQELTEAITVDIKEISIIDDNISKRSFSSMIESHAWLYSVFETVDKNQDGFVNKDEWYEAVSKMNTKLPNGLEIDPSSTWELLDSDKDDKISMMEWEKLSYALDSNLILKKWN